MEIIGGCTLIACALATTVRYRRWWGIVTAAALAAAAVVIIRTESREPPQLPARGAYDLCHLATKPLWDMQVGLLQDHVNQPWPWKVSEARMIEWGVIKSIAKEAAIRCTVTPDRCAKILDTADPSSREFLHTLSYVSRAITYSRKCAETVPPDPFSAR